MRALAVSIHAPLTGGDQYQHPQSASVAFQSTPPSREATRHQKRLGNAEHVSIHAPLTGGDLFVGAVKTNRNSVFQSTPPSREATIPLRPLRVSSRVSIHAPLTGGDF